MKRLLFSNRHITLTLSLTLTLTLTLVGMGVNKLFLPLMQGVRQGGYLTINQHVNFFNRNSTGFQHDFNRKIRFLQLLCVWEYLF